MPTFANRQRAARAQTWPSCAGPCDNARKLCPCPEACQRLHDAETDAAARRIVRRTTVAVFVVLVALALFVAFEGFH